MIRYIEIYTFFTNRIWIFLSIYFIGFTKYNSIWNNIYINTLIIILLFNHCILSLTNSALSILRITCVINNWTSSYRFLNTLLTSTLSIFWPRYYVTNSSICISFTCFTKISSIGRYWVSYLIYICLTMKNFTMSFINLTNIIFC